MKIRHHLTAVSFLALSFFGGASEALAAAPAGDKVCEQGIASNLDLLQRIEEAPTADTPLRGCHWSTRHFLEAFQYHVRTQNIDATLNTVADMPAFLRSMSELDVPRDGWFNTDCAWLVNGTYRVKIDCEQRSLREGEKVFGLKDRDGNFVVLLYTNCANTGSGEIKIVVTGLPPCIELRFPTTFQGQDVRGAYIGPQPLPGRCHLLTVAGLSEPFTNYPDECPDSYPKVLADGRTVTVTCSWDEAEANSTRVMGQPMQVQNVSYSFDARAAGTNVWQLPREALEGLPTLCWEMPDGTFVALSVSRSSFVNGVATVTVADIEASRWQEQQ